MARTERGIKRELSLMFTEITPPHGWKQDSEFHYLRLTLPGFEANDITIHMDKYGHLVVRGTRQVSERKYISFEETFNVPNDAKLDDACGMFEDDHIYSVAIPKVKNQQHAITMPKEHNNPKPLEKKDSGSIHQYNNNNNNENQEVVRPKNYLKDIQADKSKKKKIALFVAISIALLVIIVVLIVILRRT